VPAVGVSLVDSCPDPVADLCSDPGTSSCPMEPHAVLVPAGFQLPEREMWSRTFGWLQASRNQAKFLLC
jgi:hypothetical protein